MLEKDNIDLASLENSTTSEPWIPTEVTESLPYLTRHIGSGSGGYADHILKFAAMELFGIECDKLQYKELRYFAYPIQLFQSFYIFYVNFQKSRLQRSHFRTRRKSSSKICNS